MVRRGPAIVRFGLKRIPGAPGLLVDVVEHDRAPDKLRKLAGSVAGEHIAEEVYDDHTAAQKAN